MIGDAQKGVAELRPDARYNQDARADQQEVRARRGHPQRHRRSRSVGVHHQLHRRWRLIDRFAWHMSNVEGVRAGHDACRWRPRSSMPAGTTAPSAGACCRAIRDTLRQCHAELRDRFRAAQRRLQRDAGHDLHHRPPSHHHRSRGRRDEEVPRGEQVPTAPTSPQWRDQPVKAAQDNGRGIHYRPGQLAPGHRQRRRAGRDQRHRARQGST